MIPPFAVARVAGSITVGVAGAVTLWKRHHVRSARELGRITAAHGAGDDQAECRTDVQLDGQDFRKIGLPHTDLRGASLRRARLDHLSLGGVDLSGADLSHARFDGADLRGAKLDGADLEWASFRGADLTGASLSGARLVEADFDAAILRGTDLHAARSVTVANWKHAIADSRTRFPTGFDAIGAGVRRPARPETERP